MPCIVGQLAQIFMGAAFAPHLACLVTRGDKLAALAAPALEPPDVEAGPADGSGGGKDACGGSGKNADGGSSDVPPKAGAESEADGGVDSGTHELQLAEPPAGAEPGAAAEGGGAAAAAAAAVAESTGFEPQAAKGQLAAPCQLGRASASVPYRRVESKCAAVFLGKTN